MKIALVQMSMGKEISENLDKSLKYCDMAENCDLVFFPEIQLTPFFPQYHDARKPGSIDIIYHQMSIWKQKEPDTILLFGSPRKEKSEILQKWSTSHRMKIFMSRIIIHRRRTALKFLPHHLER